MRKLVASELVSLDGVVESPEKWQMPYFNHEMGEEIGAAMAAADAMVLGRVTYEEWAAFWPSQGDREPAGYMNQTPKYVVSTTLEGPLGWNNSTLIEGDVAEEIARLKRQPGGDIGISGSATLVRSLLRDGLLDELRLMLHPVVVGGGQRLFEDWEVRGRWSSWTRRPSARASSTSPTGRRASKASLAGGSGRVHTTKESTMNFVLIPGAWMGAWVWEPVTRGLRALGHRVYPVTLSGLDHREADVAGVGLETHVGDVLSVLEREDLRDAVVVGHSYSGIVAGQVADRAPRRVSRTVFVDAFLPHDGRSMLDAFPEDQREEELA